MVSDGHALGRREICEAALLNKVYSGSTIPNFTGGKKKDDGSEDFENIDGKRYNVEKISSRLKWTPNFANLSSFMTEGYEKEMNVPLLSSTGVSV